MKRIVPLLILSALLLLSGCRHEDWGRISPVPDGTPITMRLEFGAPAIPVVEMGTRAEATEVDESHVHDLYVMIFNPDADSSKLYGRYFSYEHQVTKSELDDAERECWFVENQTIPGAPNPVAQTRGAVKISTAAKENAVVIVLANISNTLTLLDGEEPIERLNAIRTLEELKSVKVQLSQDVVTRKDYFLMMSVKRGVNTGEMRWNQAAPYETQYNDAYRMDLKRMDAKVKFRIKANTYNISKITPRFWQVCKAPTGCYLFDVENGGPDVNADQTAFNYFDTEETYFDGTWTDPGTGDVYQEFTFYMLENTLRPIRSADQYSRREEQVKEEDANRPGYVKNGAWKYANANSTYVRFDVILTLNKEAILELDPDANQAMTTDVAFVVHLGDFVHSNRNDEVGTTRFDDYNTLRGTYYTYNVTIVNSTSIHTEVELGTEIDPAQEGFLLLIKDGVINCDAHYEYRSMVFNFRPGLNPNVFSWYVKTPFGEGGASPQEVDAANGVYYYPPTSGIYDYKWVLFALNKDAESGEDNYQAGKRIYSKNRRQFPGIGTYRPGWKLGAGAAAADSAATRPELLDISQLISFIFYEQAKETNTPGSSLFDQSDSCQIRLTAYVNEYYYETHPETGEVDKELWRKFVNAKPREMHILSDTKTSLDQKSDVITSSQSIIQQSIQTIYNVYDHELSSIWGTEHKDEMRELAGEYGWGFGTPVATGNDKENGRQNTAKMWGANGSRPDWSDYVNYEVDNDMPELRGDNGHQAMAFSCMTRNRDNNGNGQIDPEEVRWYLASINQLIGMYIGGDALSQTARLYQPFQGQWRAHIVSSTYPNVLTSEEGIAYYNMTDNWMSYKDSSSTGGPTIDEQRNRVRSVRCIRNIGTYEQTGVRRDISEAPLSQIPDRYFTVDTTGTGDSAYYTFRFNRLDPKALRPLTQGELPYHNERSTHNRMYLEMITQSKDQAISVPADKQMKDINPEITSAGVNPYCPPGYRVPNQVEMALMSAVLPKSYFPGGSPCMICRTYYSRGYYGIPSEQITSEVGKTGFGFNGTKVFCANNNHTPLYTRCVKDSDLTGTIMGDIFLPLDTICPAESISADFKFSSSASTFNYASLKLRYEVSGIQKEKEILLDKEPSGVQYVHSQSISIPSLATLGIAELPAEGLPLTLSFEIRNTSGLTAVADKELRLVNTHLSGSMQILPGWREGEGFPVEVKAKSFSRRYPVTSLVFSYKVGDGAWTDMPDLVEGLPEAPQILSRTIYFDPNSTTGETYTVKMHATCADGSELEYQGSIDILRANFSPAGTTWEDTATGLDFTRGDFIETRVQLTSDTNVAKRGLISIGTRIDTYEKLGSGNSCYHIYFPGSVANEYKLRRAARHESTGQGSQDMGVHDGPVAYIRFQNDGLYMDDILWNLSGQSWYNAFITNMRATTLKVGQNEGVNRSTSTYDYIRVVHQAEEVTLP